MYQRKNIPFQQHQIDKPVGSMKGRWYRRHIVIDHRHKEIQIQLMWDSSGELTIQEYYDIKKGAWHNYVPANKISEYRQVVASGYKVIPIVVAGGNEGEDHVIVQLIELEDKHHVINDSSFAAIPEEG